MRKVLNRRFLGIYLVILGAYEVIVTITSTFQETFPVSPRLGWIYMYEFTFGPHSAYIDYAFLFFPVLEYLSAAWLLLLGGLMLRGVSVQKTYLIGEALLSAPTVVLFIIVVSRLVSLVSWEGIDFALFLLATVTIFSIFPMCLAFLQLRQQANSLPSVNSG